MVICGTGCQLYIRRQGAPYQDVHTVCSLYHRGVAD